MNKEKVIEKLRDDENYYGSFGKKYLSNSDIGTLLTNPLNLGKASEARPAFLVGGYFHTAILEPDKLKKFKVIEATTRNTKAYKEMSGGELCLLQHEVDQIELLTDKMLSNQICNDLIRKGNVEYELPGITKLEGHMWKGKADIINHDEKLIIDLKTTADLHKFKYSASKYNYDSQAYIYSKLFGYEMVFIAIDKNTQQIGIFDCSPQFYEKGKDKVARAVEAYELFYKSDGFDPTQYFINKTL
ncbi:MAG: PD-(D/E)XK nuclease-like domain-containing protein [Cyanophyceae cyanobacterium]